MSRKQRRWNRHYRQAHQALHDAVNIWYGMGEVPWELIEDIIHISIYMAHAPYRGVADHETMLGWLGWGRNRYEAAVRLQQLLAEGFLYRAGDDYRSRLIDEHLERCRLVEVATGHDFTRTRWAQ